MSSDTRTEELRRHWDKQDAGREWSKEQINSEIQQTRSKLDLEHLDAQMRARTRTPGKRSSRVPAAAPKRDPRMKLMALRAKIAMDIDFKLSKSAASYLRKEVLPEFDQIITGLREKGEK